MRLTSVKLVDGSREMVLLPRMSEGVRLVGMSAPFPDVREVTEDRTDDDGTRDTTSLFGARAVSVELLVTKNPRSIEDELSRFMHPRSRPYLVVADEGWSGPRRLRLRSSGMDAPLEVDLPQRMRRIQAQWRAPDGVWESDDVSSSTVGADVDSDGGLSFPVEFPLGWAATQASGVTLLSNIGSVPAHFTARLYGPCSGPRLINQTTGEEITFESSLTLAAGDYIEIDTRERTAFLTVNGSDSQVGRLNFVNFEVTSWWRIEPGQQAVRYAPPLASAGAAAVIEWRAQWL